MRVTSVIAVTGIARWMAEELGLDSRPDKTFSLSQNIPVWLWGLPGLLSLFLPEEFSPGRKVLIVETCSVTLM
jgi:hypothetical protein